MSETVVIEEPFHGVAHPHQAGSADLREERVYNDPRWSLPTVFGIFDQPLSKSQRSDLYRVVHAFRNANHFFPLACEEPGKIRYNPLYQRAVNHIVDRHLSSFSPRSKVGQAIRDLSSEARFSEIRQVGRMRESNRPVTGIELSTLAKEVRAALIWRAQFEAFEKEYR